MKQFSLEPDERMKWIYDPKHPDYNTDRAKYLRNARAYALTNCPQWMLEEAYMNDKCSKKNPNNEPDV